MKLASSEQHPIKKFSLSAGRSFQPKKYILGLCESMLEDEKLVITMHSLHTFKQLNQPS